MEEKFFFQYHLRMSDSMKLPIIERKWMIKRFIQQKTKEKEEMEAARKKKR